MDRTDPGPPRTTGRLTRTTGWPPRAVGRPPHTAGRPPCGVARGRLLDGLQMTTDGRCRDGAGRRAGHARRRALPDEGWTRRICASPGAVPRAYDVLSGRRAPSARARQRLQAGAPRPWARPSPLHRGGALLPRGGGALPRDGARPWPRRAPLHRPPRSERDELATRPARHSLATMKRVMASKGRGPASMRAYCPPIRCGNPPTAR